MRRVGARANRERRFVRAGTIGSRMMISESQSIIIAEVLRVNPTDELLRERVLRGKVMASNPESYVDWRVRWAERVVRMANEEIARRQHYVSEVKKELETFADEENRDFLQSLIDQQEDIIRRIRESHGELKRHAKQRWSVEIGGLA
jgi:hypothetical protein